MPPYSPIWVEIARAQYLALDADTQAQVDATIQDLLEHPFSAPRSAYDLTSDQWTVTYGDGRGLITYAVVAQHRRLIVLRLV